MTTWFTADLHLSHKNVLTFEPTRPGGGDIDTHDEILIERHNALVQPDDTVWMLGDVAMGPIEVSLAKCARLNGRKILVCGNHDRPAMTDDPGKRREWIERYQTEGGFHKVVLAEEHLPERSIPLRLPTGEHVQLSHYPHAGDSRDTDRYVERRPVYVGSPLLCGHVHSAWKTHHRMVNVGVDAWDYQPVSAGVISELIRSWVLTMEECVAGGGHWWLRGPEMGGVLGSFAEHYQHCVRCPARRTGLFGRFTLAGEKEMRWSYPDGQP